MKQMHSWKTLWVAGTVLAVTGCAGSDGEAGGDGDDGDGSGPSSGTVTEPWTAYCTGTFTEDTPVNDAFGDPVFTVHAGDAYLMSAFDDSFGQRAEFVFLNDAGPDSFEVEPHSDGSWPFTSNCTFDEGVPYYAVFEDVSVFAEEGLSTKICDLSAGAVLPSTGGTGYSYVTTEGSAAIYNVLLGPFSEQCGGATDGYISVPQAQSLGSTTWLMPLMTIIGPT